MSRYLAFSSGPGLAWPALGFPFPFPFPLLTPDSLTLTLTENNRDLFLSECFALGPSLSLFPSLLPLSRPCSVLFGAQCNQQAP